VRVVEVVVGAEVWVAKAVKAVEVRWSEQLPRPRLVFLALGLEAERALSARERQPRPPLLSPIASERRPWLGAPLVAGAAFEVVTALCPRENKTKHRPSFSKEKNTEPESVGTAVVMYIRRAARSIC
jgi:hypothetical protein